MVSQLMASRGGEYYQGAMRRALPIFLAAACWAAPAAAEGEPASEEEERTESVDEDDDPAGAERLADEETPLEDEPLEVVTRGPPRARSASQVSRGRDVLSANPSRTGSDLLKTVPGVFVTQHSGEGKAHQIFFRGYDAVHGQDLEINVGGIPVNEVSNVHGQGYADLHFVIPEVVERIDALPGAFDPSQGDFAIAGSMRYQLGWDEPGLTVGATYGSFRARRLFAAYHPEGQPHETFAAGELYATDGFGVARSASRASFMGQVLFPLTRELSARVFASVYSGRFDSPGVLPRADVDAGIVDRFDSYDPEQGGESARTQLTTELRYDDDHWSGAVAPFVIRRTLRLAYNFTGFLDDPVNGDNATQRHDFTAIGVTGRLEREVHLLSERDKVGGGIYARHDIVDQDHRPSAGGGAAFVDNDLRATDVGGWAELQLRPWSRLLVRGGARVDLLAFSVDDALAAETRSAQGLVATPKVSLDLGIVPGLNAVASYAQGFRSPQARSLADGETAPFTRMNGWELGLRYRDGLAIDASLSGFATLLDDDLVFNEATSRNEAAPGTLRLGAAANLEARPNDWFVGVVGASYTRATLRGSNERLAEGDLLPFVPQLVLRGDVAARPVLTRLAGRELRGIFGFGTNYLYNRPLPFGEIGTDVLLFDARVGLRLKEIEIRVDGTNLLGSDYNDGEFVYASSFDPTAATSLVPQRHLSAGAPRTVLGTLLLYL